jgi:cyclohexa-1,5-dienecarbonyl-CoA hydratase
MTAIETLVLEEGRLLSLTLARPKANVLDAEMMTELEKELAAHENDKHLRAVLLRGKGGNFSFGASVPEHKKDNVRAMLSTFHRVTRAVAKFPVPIIALVEGRCLGGAFELALACHVVLAKDDAIFACPEVKLGVIPPVLSVLGHLRLGGALAERMLITGAEIDAQTARACGFVAEIVPEADPFDAAHKWYAQKLAPLSAFSLREATLAARRGSGMLAQLGAPLEAAELRYLERLVPSHDGNEGIEAFLAKRPPKWEDA